MNRTFVILRTRYKDCEVDNRCFDSVSACAIYFAHEARRQYEARGLKDDDLLDAVVNDVALLFASPELTTSEDPEDVHGGDDNTSYICEINSLVDTESAVAIARAEDEKRRTGGCAEKGGRV